MNRYFIIGLILTFSFAGLAQSDCGWHPDSDGDNLIGVSDLMALLAVFAESDLDADGIWDSSDDCVGQFDECGNCNGPGPQLPAIDYIVYYYDSVYAEPIDEWFVFVVDSDTILTLVCDNPGCMDSFAINFDPYAVESDGSCVYDSDVALCGGAMTFSYEGHTYPLEVINDRCYFAENLQSEGGITPSALLELDPYIVSWDAGVPESDSAFVSNFGYLYSADAGHCPEGWHVPEIEEAGGGGIGGGYVTIGGLHNGYFEQSRWWSSTPVNMENWPYMIGLPPPYYYYGDGSGDLHYPAVPEYFYHKTCVKNVE